jgi:hypothetical protein
MKVVFTDNIDSVMKAFSKLENTAVTELTKESRKAVRADMRKFMPQFKAITPKKTGALRRSVKIKSRSRRGTTKLSMIWQNDYAGYVNFAKNIKGSNNPNSRKVTNLYQHLKSRMDRDISISIRNVYRKILKAKGFNVT